jgi:membrane protease YdiL (CAAX protease family)
MRRFWHGTAIWLLILALAALMIYEPRRTTPREADGDASEPQAQQDPQVIDAAAILRGRLMVQSQDFSGQASVVSTADLILGESPLERLASAILLANHGDHEQAIEQIRLASDAMAGAGMTEDDADLIEATRAAVDAWPAPGRAAGEAPDEDQFDALRDRLGWFGDLAQARVGGDADLAADLRADDMAFMLSLFAAGCWLLAIGFAGFVLLVVLSVFALGGRIQSGLSPQPGTSLVLGETFAAWFALFVALQFAALLVPLDADSPRRLALMGTLMLASLVALGWASRRGVSFDRLRDLAGLRWSGGAWRLLWQSLVAYATALPLMGLGLLIGVAMGRLLHVPDLGNPSHPIQKMVIEAEGLELWLLFALACVVAPIVEETTFRGLLYGHLRQGTARWGVAGSMLFSMAISGALFAAIHPQGMFVAPALAGLACGFCLTREWSGSVYPGMVAHGIQNATMLTLNILLFHA